MKTFLISDGAKLAAFGRDQLMSVWEVETQSCLHLVPTYEEMERALILDRSIAKKAVEGKHAKDRFCMAAGEKGQVTFKITSKVLHMVYK